MNKKVDIPFSEILSELLDPERAFNPTHIIHLSRLAPGELKELAAAWGEIPLARRRSLVADLENFAESDALLFFDDIGKIALSDEDSDVRSAAIRLMAIEEAEDFAETLLGILKDDPHFEVRAVAATALGKYVYLGELEDIPEQLFRSVEDGLLAAYRSDPQTLVRRRALEAVSFSSRKEVNSMIEDAYSSLDEDWQVSAVFAMGASANQRWEPRVVDVLDSDSAVIRIEAAHAAGKLDIQDAKPALFLLAAQDDDEAVRRAAIWGLSDLGGQDVSDFLEELLEEAEKEDEVEFIEEALDNLMETQFFNEMDMPLFEFEEPDLDELVELDPDDDEGD